MNSKPLKCKVILNAKSMKGTIKFYLPIFFIRQCKDYKTIDEQKSFCIKIVGSEILFGGQNLFWDRTYFWNQYFVAQNILGLCLTRFQALLIKSNNFCFQRLVEFLINLTLKKTLCWVVSLVLHQE